MTIADFGVKLYPTVQLSSVGTVASSPPEKVTATVLALATGVPDTSALNNSANRLVFFIEGLQ
jgi:hypothetical protein